MAVIFVAALDLLEKKSSTMNSIGVLATWYLSVPCDDRIILIDSRDIKETK